MGYFFTFKAATQVVRIGAVVELKADPSTAEGVDVCINDKKVGFITDDPNLVVGKANVPAGFIRKSVLNHSKCASAHGLVLNCERRKQEDGVFFLYGVELYVVPKRDANTETDKVILRYKVGGISAQNPKKAEYNGRVQQLIDAKQPVNIPVSILREMVGSDNKYLICPELVTAGDSAGEIINADDTLENLIPVSESIPAKIVDLSGRNMIVEVVPQTSDIDKYHPIIDSAISRCAGQSKVLEEKVETMLSARFDENLITAVVGQMPSLGAARNGVPNPTTKYTQKNGSNLSDLTSYMLMGKMVRLVGDKGSGKNTLIETACWLLNRPLCRVQGSSELDKLDLLGSHTLRDGNTSFALSEFLTTLKNDGIAVIDEVNTVRPEVLTLLHSLTDGARAIDVPGYGTVKMGPHACILYTLNEDYVGTGEMNAATVDRGPSMFIEQESNMTSLLRSAVPDASEQNIKICCTVSDEIRKAVKSGSSILTSDAITVRGYIDALQCAKYIPLRRALIQNVANKAQTGKERQAIEGIITANVV